MYPCTHCVITYVKFFTLSSEPVIIFFNFVKYQLRYLFLSWTHYENILAYFTFFLVLEFTSSGKEASLFKQFGAGTGLPLCRFCLQRLSDEPRHACTLY